MPKIARKSPPRKSVSISSGFTVAGLIFGAREMLGMTQTQFAAKFSLGQTSISKYERGDEDPPARVIEECMSIIESNQKKPALTANDIAHRVRTEIAGPEFAPLRKAFAYMLDTVSPRRSGRR